MNRRSFITSILEGSVAPLFLKGTGRIWKPSREIIQVTHIRLANMIEFVPLTNPWRFIIGDP